MAALAPPLTHLQQNRRLLGSGVEEQAGDDDSIRIRDRHRICAAHRPQSGKAKA
jgi:hypothetical protein